MKVHLGLLIVEQRHLRNDDVEVTVNTKFVPVGGDGQGPFGRLDRGFLFFPFLGEDAQRRQTVFHLLERG